MEKECTKCKQVKPLEEFHKHTKSKDGRKEACKECRNRENTEYRKKNPPKPTKRKYFHQSCSQCKEEFRRRSDAKPKYPDLCLKCANRKSAAERLGVPLPNALRGTFVECDHCGKRHYKKLSQLKRGHEHLFCSQKCQGLWSSIHRVPVNLISSVDNSGKNNGRYKHGKRIGGHDRHKNLKKKIVARDGKGCLLCKSEELIHVHRVTPGALGGKYEIGNTVILCNKHHEEVHLEYDRWKDKLLMMITKDKVL